MLLQCTFGIYVTRQHARANGCLRVYDVLFLICGGMFLHVCDALPFCVPAHRKTHFATKWLFGFMSCVLIYLRKWLHLVALQVRQLAFQLLLIFI